MTDDGYQGPKRGADRAVLLAHGAGADMHAAALDDRRRRAGRRARSRRCASTFPYRRAGRRAPDRPPVLLAAVREAAAELARRAKLPPDRLVLGGRSMGGRIGSMVAADADDPIPALGLVLLGYPLHPPGKAEKLRVEHFPRLTMPVLFVSGTRDAFGTPGRAEAPREEDQGPGDVLLDRDRRPQLQAAEVERAQRGRRAAGVADAVVEFVGEL